MPAVLVIVMQNLPFSSLETARKPSPMLAIYVGLVVSVGSEPL